MVRANYMQIAIIIAVIMSIGIQSSVYYFTNTVNHFANAKCVELSVYKGGRK